MTSTRTVTKTLASALLVALVFAGSPQSAFAIPDFSQELIAITPVTATDFTFVQDGFTDGASVTGSFSGTDTDGNGQLSWFAGEVTAFAMTFSGNALVPSFSLGFANLFGLVYDLNGGPLGDGLDIDIEGVGAEDAIAHYLAGPGPFEVCGIGENCAIVEAVPEPGIALLGIIAAVGLVRRRIRR
jgi:hypothetical protein